MRFSTHTAISLGYAFAVSVVAGAGYKDWRLYLAALAGGHILDVDHVLFLFVYRRKHPTARHTRTLLQERKISQAIQYMSEIEDRHAVQELALHNVYVQLGLVLCALLTILVGSVSPYALAFLGALILHTLSDQVGDFAVLGHADNWLWVFSETMILRLRRLGSRLLYGLAAYLVLVIGTFALLILDTAWKLSLPRPWSSLVGGLARIPLMRWAWYLPFFILLCYFVLLAVLCAASVRKYHLEMGGRRVIWSLGSLRRSWTYLRERHVQRGFNFERVLLGIQADQLVWTIVLTAMIAVGLWLLSLTGLDHDLAVFLLPIVLALFFGSVVHTTIGELGGVFGVFLATSVNFLAARVGLVGSWPASRILLLFGAAASAWILGLLGGIFIRGLNRMSIVAFNLEIELLSDSATPQWSRALFASVEEGLEEGYRRAHLVLRHYQDVSDQRFITTAPVNAFVTPYVGPPLFGQEQLHYVATDTYRPLFWEAMYALCGSRLFDEHLPPDQPGWLPVMPRWRDTLDPLRPGDIRFENGSYVWQSNRRKLTLLVWRSSLDTECENQVGLTKTLPEFVDHFLTRRSSFRTDLFICSQGQETGQDGVTICGLVREVTSTKEFATVEAEFYASQVLQAIREALIRSKIEPSRITMVRVYHPRVSIYDQELAVAARRTAVLAPCSSTISRDDFAQIRQTLNQLPVQRLLPSVTANLPKRLAIWIVEVGVAAYIGQLGLNPATSELITNFMGTLF